MFCFSLATPSRDLDGSCSFNEAETQNLLASRQQNQAVCVGKGKRGRGATSTAGHNNKTMLLMFHQLFTDFESEAL